MHGEQAVEVRQALLGDEAHHERDADRVRDAGGALAQVGEVLFGVPGVLDPEQVGGPPQATLRVMGLDELGDDRFEVAQHIDLARQLSGVHGVSGHWEDLGPRGGGVWHASYQAGRVYGSRNRPEFGGPGGLSGEFT